jgi:hypothetical protein
MGKDDRKKKILNFFGQKFLTWTSHKKFFMVFLNSPLSPTHVFNQFIHSSGVVSALFFSFISRLHSNFTPDLFVVSTTVTAFTRPSWFPLAFLGPVQLYSACGGCSLSLSWPPFYILPFPFLSLSWYFCFAGL